MRFDVFPIPDSLKEHVVCIRTTEHNAEEGLAINVCVNGLPGIVFQHSNGHSPVENITTSSGFTTGIPTLYVYGQMMQPGVMNHKKVSFTSTQFVLQPHALQALLGINASLLTNSVVELAEFSSTHLNMQLLEAPSEQARITLLTDFLLAKLTEAKTRDRLVEASLHLIHRNAGTITIKHLLECLSISERQFERRFTQSVGLSPHFYLRVKRFNEAIRLMKNRRFEKLTEVAHALSFYDQSHFIRDIKAFSGISPKDLFRKADDFHLDQKVIAYTSA